MNLVAGALAVALAVLPVAIPTAASAAGGGETAAGAPTIELTTRNWGRQVPLTDPARPAYAHVFLRSTVTVVTAVFHFGHPLPAGFTATLVDAQAYDGHQPAPCVSASAPSEASCVFDLAVTGGVNALELTLVPTGSAPIVRHGRLTGGAFLWSGGLEAMDAAGIWQAIPDGGELRLPSAQFTSVRYVVRNVGGVPFRVADACVDRLIEPGGSIACPIAGPRPVASLGGDYTQELALADPLSSIGRTSFDGAIAPTAVSFRLPAADVAVGQQVALRTAGITDRDLGLLDVRVGSRPLRLSPESTAREIRFAIPFAAPGETTLDVLQSGVTIARLPITVAGHAASAPARPFPIVLVVLSAVGGALLAVLAWRAVGWRYSARSRTT